MNIFAIFLLLISLISPLQSSECQCRKVKDESPALGTVSSTMRVGIVRKLQGRVFYPNLEKMKDAIVEVYVNDSQTSDENISDDEVKRILNGKRKLACMTDEDGRFCIPKLSRGRYLLRIGHRSDRQFGIMHVVVTLDPRDNDSSAEDLEVILDLSI